MTSPLRVDGPQIRDEQGRTMVLRGINHYQYVNSLDGTWGPETGYDLLRAEWSPEKVESQLDEYLRSGFNLVRFHTLVDWWKRNPDSRWMLWHTVTYPEPYRAMFKDMARWAAERDLYVIFTASPAARRSRPAWSIASTTGSSGFGTGPT